MIEKFDSFEEASLFVQNKQAEGFEATIVNESVGFLWGPRVVGGFRVEVGEKRESLEEGFAPETEVDSLASRSVRVVVALIIAVGAGVALLTAALALRQAMGLIGGLALVLLVCVVAGFFLFRNDFRRRGE